MARVLTIDPRRPDEAILAEAARVLRSGGLVAFPTETVYGLGARAFDEAALHRVFAAKGRPSHHPLIAHVEGEKDARALARAWPDAASRLARALWPGPLTLVVERAAHISSVIAGGGDSIAVRAPSHPVARGLIAALGEPVAAPSANLYQQLSPTAAIHVIRQLGDAVDLVLDGGSCEEGIESTVVDVRGEVTVLRPGALGLARLRDIVPGVESYVASAKADALRPSPGMDARHYSPRAPLHIVETPDEARALAASLGFSGARVGVVTCDKWDGAVPGGLVLRALGADASTYAHHLYGTLHELDAEGVAAIVILRVPRDETWWAIADRLQRAAATG